LSDIRFAIFKEKGKHLLSFLTLDIMRILLILISVAWLISCHNAKLPTEVYPQSKYLHTYSFEENNLSIVLGNPLMCPLRIWIFSESEAFQSTLSAINPIELSAGSDTLLLFEDIDSLPGDLRFSSRLGSIYKEILPKKLELPFPKDRSYRIIQGNNSNGTHNSDWSRYALDFDLQINDTICAATDGFVVGIVNQYEYGGKGKEWRPFGNFITIYDTESGLFTQYVHLIKDGSLVKVGDKVQSGQPIGLSGNTGQSDGPHLHFNCLKPAHTNDGLISIPYEFVEGYASEALQKGDVVKK
jgi:hypothetical protein